MDKLVRKAVRVYLVDGKRVVVIKYNNGNNRENFYDIPGGKIENGETNLETSKREFKEETGMDVLDLKLVGNLIVEYPDKIFDFDIFICKKYNGIPSNFEDNNSMWISIDEISNIRNSYPSLELLEPKYINYLNNTSEKFKIYIKSDNKHNILE